MFAESDHYDNYAGSVNGEDPYTSLTAEQNAVAKRDGSYLSDSNDGPPRKKVTSNS